MKLRKMILAGALGVGLIASGSQAFAATRNDARDNRLNERFDGRDNRYRRDFREDRRERELSERRRVEELRERERFNRNRRENSERR